MVGRHWYRALVAAGGLGLLLTIGAAFVLPHQLGAGVAHAWAWAAVVPLFLVGLLAILVRPNHPSARWLGVAGSLLAIETAGRRLLPQLVDAPTGVWLAGSLSLQVAVLATAASIASVLVVFPDDHYQYRYQPRALRAIWLFVVAVPAVLMVSQRWLYFPPTWSGQQVVNPLFVPALAPLGEFAEAAFDWRVLLWVGGAAAMVVRYRRAADQARRQFRWPLVAAVALIVQDGALRLLQELDGVPPGLGVRVLFLGLVPGMLLLSGSILVALLRHRLIGIDLWLRRSILFGGTSALIALAYLGAAGLLGLAAGHRLSLGVGVLVTLVAVVAFQPFRRRLDRWARRWVFGDRLTGGEVLRRVGDTLEDAHDINQLGSRLTRTVVEALELEWARLSLSAGASSDVVAAAGISEHSPAAPDLVVPLSHLGSTVGFIECGPKRDGELTRADEALLATVARQAALAVNNVHLTEELEDKLVELRRQADELAASRNRIMHAQMEERHRIERNIHDGVQQEIVALIAKVRLARNQLGRDPLLAEATLAEWQSDARRTLENLRELSRGIHASVLTHQGLVEALRTQADLLPIDVQMEVAARARDIRFPSQVEETAYYVVSEGLTNVLKHADTERAVVRLDLLDGQLTVEVSDRGEGYDGDHTEGSGIVGLRDRLGAIGGQLQVRSRAGHGTTLTAALPTREVPIP